MYWDVSEMCICQYVNKKRKLIALIKIYYTGKRVGKINLFNLVKKQQTRSP